MELFNQENENFRCGYVKIYRSTRDHYLFQDKNPYSKFEAWTDILLKVNYEERKVNIKNVVFVVGRGESMRSLDTWASAWRWDKSKVRRFLETLQKENMVVLKNEQLSTRLTVCNYDTYQCERNVDETQMKRKRNANDTQATPNKEVKKVVNYKIDITVRKELFKEEIKTFENSFEKQLLNEFYKYLSEINSEKTKMRWEMEKTWETNLRIGRCKLNNKSNNSNNRQDKQSKSSTSINSHDEFTAGFAAKQQ